MASFEHIRPYSSSGTLKLADVAKITDTLKRGGLAVLPSETGYMIAALATSIEAIRTAFAVKERNHSNTMHIACSSLKMAEKFGELTQRARRLLGELTPGPITVIVEQTQRLPKSFVTLNGTVGIRIPDNPATLQVIADLQEPVTATSLNRAGEDAISVDQNLESLNWPAREVVQVVEAPNATMYSIPSTLVRVTGPEIEILRRGPISPGTITEILNRQGYLDVSEWT